jgi:uncharacterized protein
MPDEPVSLAPTIDALASSPFVSIVTFKRNGDAVAAPMWVARDGDDLVMWTPAESWKVKRLRRDPRAVLLRCTRMGKVDPLEPAVTGTAVVDAEPAAVDHAEQLIRRKYGLQFHVITTLETILARGRKERVALRITPQQVSPATPWGAAR